MKRLFDLLLALILIGPATLIVVLAAIAVVFDSPGRPLLRQQRVGRDRKPFMMLKLRTMVSGTASVASHEVGTAAITRVGAFLRRTKIDELPQILSVLLGDMSFVGPRPCLPSQLELIAEREGRGVFGVRPGITGSAQLAGIDMSTPRRLAEADAAYVADRSLAKDLAIVLRTLLGSGRGDAAS